ncbi:MAG: sugar phosphate nucleotidyltransferase [Muribaculaceae bacterium]
MKPTLLVLAAGMGSRYGGLKQLDGVGPHGETIMDYSVYDAMRAGFGKVVFVIRHDFEDDFNTRVLSKYKNHIPVTVVYQETDSLPEGYTVPEDRTRPWGTGHAVMMGADAINEPFAVINADDFYGRNAFEVMADFLKDSENKQGRYCMVAFKVGNTMTENGSVSRGVCTVDDNNCLSSIVERRRIEFDGDHNPVFIDEETEQANRLDATTPVSMNLWGFTPDFFIHSQKEFKRFLDLFSNDNKREFYIPNVVDFLINNGKASVRVLTTDSRWFGVTYADDRQNVCDNLEALHSDGTYPETLF